jgi:hypothetical protein
MVKPTIAALGPLDDDDRVERRTIQLPFLSGPAPPQFGRNWDRSG